MNQTEAIKRATVFVLENIGVEADPESARLVDRPGERRYWSIVYRPEALLLSEAAHGVTIDGPYVLHVDDANGEVSVFG